jgi:hypothetical protein
VCEIKTTIEQIHQTLHVLHTEKRARPHAEKRAKSHWALPLHAEKRNKNVKRIG